MNDPLTLLEGDSGVNRAREILQSYEKYGNTMKVLLYSFITNDDKYRRRTK